MYLRSGPVYFDIHFNVDKYEHKCAIMIVYAKYTKLSSNSRPTEKSIQESW